MVPPPHPKKGKRSNKKKKKGCGKMGLTPDLLWLALSCVLCGEGMEECLFICLLHPQYPHTLMEYEPAPFLVTSLVFLTSL